MTNIANLLTEHMAIWTAADTEKKSGRGRASGNAGSVYGVKKLRELILELAVRGKLVPQDPNDEPASELLKRIALENGKPNIQITTEEKSFELPQKWEYARLGSIFNIVYGKGLPNSELTEDGYDVFGANGIIGKYTKYLYEEPQLLISCRGAYSGKPNISPPKCFVTSNSLVLGSSWENIDLKYFYYSLSIANKEKIVTGSAQPQVTTTNLEPFVIGLPPLPEQHRIVAKVDELMALCDQLEQQHSSAQEAHETLVSQLLATLTQSQNAAEFNANWQRIYANFDVLFTTEASIDALKQTLLQLAVMGKLVPQDPSDEPASELIKRIQAEKTKLIAEGKLKKEKPLVPISEDEKPFELPKGWMFVRLRELATHLGDGLHGTPHYSDKGEYYFVNGNNLKDGRIVIKYETKRVDFSEFEKYKKPLNDNSVLVSINGTLGAVGFYDGEPVVLGKSACYINLVQGKVSKYFIKLLIDAPSFMEYANKNATGTTIKNLGLKAINDFPVALAPLAEQHRIVAKVDALMALCDQLKARIQQANQQQQAIANALVAQTVVES